MKNSVMFSGMKTMLPESWIDVTDDLPDGSPITLAKPDGIGALQFTFAKYQAGALPEVGVDDLHKLLVKFAKSRDLGNLPDVQHGCGLHPYVVSDFRGAGELVRVWYLSNSKDVVLITYVTQQPDSKEVHDELRDATKIVESLDFS